jgi:hypothetical protein
MIFNLDCCGAKLNQRMHSSPPPPNLETHAKKTATLAYDFNNFTESVCANLHLHFYKFTILKLRSTTEQMPALVITSIDEKNKAAIFKEAKNFFPQCCDKHWKKHRSRL